MPEEVGSPISLLVRVPDGVALALPTAITPNFELPGVASTGATPVPLRETVAVVARASSATVSVAVRIPCAEGVNVTVMVQVSSGPSVLGRRGQFPPAA
jgi:hypothetical protein